MEGWLSEQMGWFHHKWTNLEYTILSVLPRGVIAEEEKNLSKKDEIDLCLASENN